MSESTQDLFDLFNNALDSNRDQNTLQNNAMSDSTQEELTGLLTAYQKISSTHRQFLAESLLSIGGDSPPADPGATVIQDSASANDASTINSSSEQSVPGASDLPSKIGRYRVLAFISQGGMGSVYLAEHPYLREIDGHGNQLPQKVAIKVGRRETNATRRDDLSHEASILCSLQHENIARVQDLAFEGDKPHLVMEYVSGGSLANRMKRSPLDISASVKLVASVARAVHYAHQKNIFHRDLKPANILLTNEGQPKVIDFGLASLQSALHQTENTPTPGGTIRYMPPEQAAAARSAFSGAGDSSESAEDIRSDVFSLGAVLYELLAEKPLYSFDNQDDGLEKAINCEFDTLALNHRLIPARVRRACFTALSKDKSRRFRSAKSFADAIDPPIVARVVKYAVPTMVAVVALLILRPLMLQPEPAVEMRQDAVTAIAPAVDTSTSGTGKTSMTPGILDDSIRFTHFAKVSAENATPGPLFRNGPTREDDDLRIDADFPEPKYCFLIALNPDGNVQLCYPESPEKIQPEPLDALHYPPNSNQGFGFTDGPGQQAFLLIQSRQSLPSYEEWAEKIGELRSLGTNASGRWIWRDGQLLPWSERGPTRGDVRNLKGSEDFAAICARILASSDVDIYGVSFPVEKP